MAIKLLGEILKIKATAVPGSLSSAERRQLVRVGIPLVIEAGRWLINNFADMIANKVVRKLNKK